jgi:uncharacterized repeat protein (TIGR03803 family)
MDSLSKRVHDHVDFLYASLNNKTLASRSPKEKRGLMPFTHIHNVRKTIWTVSHRLALAFVLLTAFLAARLNAQTFDNLYDFNCSTGGCQPLNYGALTQGTDGNLYGTTTQGGRHGFGTIFKVTTSGTRTDLFEFDSASGENPSAGLTLASDGNFYGTTFAGGSSDSGTVFRFTPPSTLKVLHNFNGTDGENPVVPPTEAEDGNLYGTTEIGTTYRVTLPGGTFTQLPNNAPGETFAPLYLANDGNLYGTTAGGGTSGNGTVFRMTTAGVIKTIYNFTAMGTDGAGPFGGLTQGKNGYLYGTTEYGGGSADAGTVFQMALSGNETVLHVFVPSTDGARPFAGLVVASSGSLYGTTTEGGADGNGTIFQITEGGSFSKIVDFTGASGLAPGSIPTTALMQNTNGSLYGLTANGGSTADSGNFYSLTPRNPLLSVIVAGPVWVSPGDPVEILGNDLNEVVNVEFAGVQAQFQPGSDTYLTATVPSDAIDGLITVSLANGQQIESQRVVHILPVITNLDPSSGPVGREVAIVGGGFAGTMKVTFGGVKATTFSVDSPRMIVATVPAGAKTGKVTVTTHNGTATSKETFTVN